MKQQISRNGFDDIGGAVGKRRGKKVKIVAAAREMCR